MELQQMDLFGSETEPKLDSGLQLNDGERFCLEPGAKVYINQYYKSMYEVISDNGKAAHLRSYNHYNDTYGEEINVKSKDIWAIAYPQIVPLPRFNRPKSIDLHEFLMKEKLFFRNLTQDKMMDMITYLTTVSARVTAADRFLRRLEEGLSECAKDVIEYGFSYIPKMGALKKYFISVSHVTNEYTIKWLDYDITETFTLDQIYFHYMKMLKRIERPIEELNEFELMLFYRTKGYKLHYRLETDEWELSHPYSEQLMEITQGRKQLNDWEGIIQKYERLTGAFRTEPLYFSHTDDHIEKEVSITKEEKNGFRIEPGTLVRLAGNFRNLFKVIKDQGERATIMDYSNGEESGECKEVKREEIAFIQVDKFFFVKLPTFNRPSSLTVEMLAKREGEYYSSLSPKEMKDMAVYRISKFNVDSYPARFDRAMLEGNEQSAKKFLEGHCGGSSDRYAGVRTEGKKFEFHNKMMENGKLTFSSQEIIKHYKLMMWNIKSKPASKLSLHELRLAYRLLGYNLEYNMTTDEYWISHQYGLKSMGLHAGRQQANKIEETIKMFEEKL